MAVKKNLTSPSIRVLLVHRALQDLLVPLDPTCPHLPPLKDFLLGMLDHLVHLAVMAFKANKEYQ